MNIKITTSRLIIIKLFKINDNKKTVDKQKQKSYTTLECRHSHKIMEWNFESVETKKCKCNILYLMKVNPQNKGKPTSSNLWPVHCNLKKKTKKLLIQSWKGAPGWLNIYIIHLLISNISGILQYISHTSWNKTYLYIIIYKNLIAVIKIIWYWHKYRHIEKLEQN